MSAADHPGGGYRFVPGIPPYSGGVAAQPGHRIVHVTFLDAPSWQDGFGLIDQHLATNNLPAASLCSIELRCPRPHSFEGFVDFNNGYRQALRDRSLLLGEENPIARTNVSPVGNTLTETQMFGFGYVVPDASHIAPSFVIAGAGDLRNQADLTNEALVAAGSRWLDVGAERAGVVLDEMEARLTALGIGWPDASTVDVYTAESLHHVLGSTILPRLGSAAGRGVHWYLAHPPIERLTFEMDLRGGTEERWI